MSRLDNMIRRLTAQQLCLNAAARLVRDLPGPVLEIGLGKGRTYDHLRELFPEREVYAFDRHIVALPECTPDIDHMILGDFRETLPSALGLIGARASLAHCDFASGNPRSDAALAGWLAAALRRLMADGGVIVTDREMRVAGWRELELPEGVKKDRYYMYMHPGP